MTADLHGPKDSLRKQIREALDNISPAGLAAASGQARIRLKERAIWKNAKSVLFFAPLPNEVDVWPLLGEALDAGKITALPWFDSTSQDYTGRRVKNLQSEIVAGRFGIREPSADSPEISPGDLELILVPGVAFDLKGHRLGRGQGYYDRLLANAHGIRCGVAFDEQIVKTIPAGALDIRMDFILTPTRCLKT